MRWLCVVAVVALGACAGSDRLEEPGTDGGTGTADGGWGTFTDQGYCFPHTAPCTRDLECTAKGFPSCETILGHCRAWTECLCASAADCPADNVCLINERVCGSCQPVKASCTTSLTCADGEGCVAGRCTQPCQ